MRQLFKRQLKSAYEEAEDINLINDKFQFSDTDSGVL